MRANRFVADHERSSRFLRKESRDPRSELRMCVQPGSHGGPANRQFEQGRFRAFDCLACPVELCRVAGHLLAERHRHRVLEVGSPHLDHIGKRLGLLFEGPAQSVDRWTQPAVQHVDRTQVHGGRNYVVTRLAAIYVVVGVDEPPRAADATEELAAAIGEDLVHIHVRLRAAAALPDREWELGVVAAVDDFRRSGHDGLRHPGIDEVQVLVDPCRRALYTSDRMHQSQRHRFARVAEMVAGALRLRSPEPVGGHLD